MLKVDDDDELLLKIVTAKVSVRLQAEKPDLPIRFTRTSGGFTPKPPDVRVE